MATGSHLSQNASGTSYWRDTTAPARVALQLGRQFQHLFLARRQQQLLHNTGSAYTAKAPDGNTGSIPASDRRLLGAVSSPQRGPQINYGSPGRGPRRQLQTALRPHGHADESTSKTLAN